jgi:hypothetical protein
VTEIITVSRKIYLLLKTVRVTAVMIERPRNQFTRGLPSSCVRRDYTERMKRVRVERENFEGIVNIIF